MELLASPEQEPRSLPAFLAIKWSMNSPRRMSDIESYQALLARIVETSGPDRALDGAIAAALNLCPADMDIPDWTRSIEEAVKLLRRLLPGRHINLPDEKASDGFYYCTVELYGSMPATPPCAVGNAKTAPLAALAAMFSTLTAIERNTEA